MPRKPRIEYNGAIYHVINRGNYRQDLFQINQWKTGRAFEKTLFECCEMKNWVLHGYCIMSNHYHLCIETPNGNLCSGMQWLQSVFANRFNHYVKMPGHVFQGRYKALLVDPKSNLLPLVDYIHLNPVRAGLVTVSNLQDYLLSSLPKYSSAQKSKTLSCEKWLSHAGLSGCKEPMSEYLKYLEQKERTASSTHTDEEVDFMSGWCVGDEAFKREVMERLETQFKGEKSKLSRIGEEHWNFELQRCLRSLNKSNEEVLREKKSADWKLYIALYLKFHLGAGNRYLSDNLNMGDLSNLSKQVNQLRKTEYIRSEIWEKLTPKN